MLVLTLQNNNHRQFNKNVPYRSKSQVSLNYFICKLSHIRSYSVLLNHNQTSLKVITVKFIPVITFAKRWSHLPKIMEALSKNNKATVPLASSVIPSIDCHNISSTSSTAEDTVMKDKSIITKNEKGFMDKLFGDVSFIHKTKGTNHTSSNVEAYHVIRNRESIYTILQYYLKLDQNITHDQRMLLQYLINMLKTNPNYIMSRQGQVVIEVLNSRQRFDESLLKEIFPDFQLVDLLKRNQGVSDVSTMFNLLISSHLAAIYPDLMNADPKIVNATIIPQFDPNNVPSSVHGFIKHSQAVTGNTISDLTLCNIPFDYKATPSNNKNFLVLWDYEQFILHNDVSRYNEAQQRALSRLQSRTDFQKILLETLNKVLNDKSLDPISRQNIINTVILKNIKNMTIQDRASLIFPIDNKPFIPNPLIDKEIRNIDIPIKRSAIDSGATRQAIMGVVNTWSFQQQKTFHEATKSSFMSGPKETPKEEMD